MSSPLICAAGSLAKAISCTPCTKGTFSNDPTDSTCTACTGVNYCPNAGMTAPLTCASGSLATSTSCKPCTKGTFSNDPTDSACTVCSGSNFCPNTGMTAPEVCAPGSRATSTSCKSCSVGTFSKTGTQCSQCNASASDYCPFIALQSPLTCQAGFTVSANRQKCQPCPAGSKCQTVASSESCPATSYSFGYSTTCKSCLANSGNVCSGSSQQFCALGQYTNSHSCQSCPLGKECLDRESAIDCKSGQVRLAGDLACQQCDYNSQCPDNTTQNVCSTQGQIQSSDKLSCVNCAAGKECPNTLKKQFSCFQGLYSVAGSKSCSLCPAGSSCISTAAISCTLLSEYSPLGYDKCYQCPFGAKCDNTSSFTLCTLGQYWSNGCLDCPAGEVCPDGFHKNSPVVGFSTQGTGSSAKVIFTQPGFKIDNNSLAAIKIQTDGAYTSYFLPTAYNAAQWRMGRDKTPSFPTRVLPIGLYITTPTGSIQLTTVGKTSLFGKIRDIFDTEINIRGAGNSFYPSYADYQTPTATVYDAYTPSFTTIISSNSFSKCNPDSAQYPNSGSTSCLSCQKQKNCSARLRVIKPPTTFISDCDNIDLPPSSSLSAKLSCYKLRHVAVTCLNNRSYHDTPDTLNDHLRHDKAYPCTQISAGKSFTAPRTQQDCVVGKYNEGYSIHCSVNMPGYNAQTPGASEPDKLSDACEIKDICRAKYSSVNEVLKCNPGSSGVLKGQFEFAQGCGINKAGVVEDGSSSTTNCLAGTFCPRGSLSLINCIQGTKNSNQNAEIYQCLPCASQEYCYSGKFEATPPNFRSVTNGANFWLLGYRGTQFSGLGMKINRLGALPAFQKVPIGFYKYNLYQSGAGVYEKVCLDGTSQNSQGADSMLSCNQCDDRFRCVYSALGSLSAACTQQVCVRSLKNGQGCQRGSKVNTGGVLTTPVLNQFNCMNSDAGKGKEAAGGSTEVDCQRGYFCPAGSNWTNMYSCSPGKFNANTGQSAQTACVDCNDGRICPYGSTTNNGSANCRVGHYCVKGVQQLCVQFNKRTPTVGSTSVSDCANCNAGKHCDMLENRDGAEDDCQDAYYNPGSGSPCVLVSDDKFANSGKTAEQNPPNHMLARKSAYYPCPDGKQCTAGSQSDCPVGKKCNQVDNQSSSSPGTYDGPKACLVGQNCPIGTKFQENCSPGTYTEVVTDASQCQPLAQAQFNIGDKKKQACIARFYCPTASSSPTYCGDGKTSNLSSFQQSDCTDCPSGSYCIDSVVDACSPYPGFLCLGGLSIPTRCQVGKRALTAGLSTCQDCPNGHYCPNTAMSVIPNDQFKCEAGYFCPTGSQNKKGKTSSKDSNPCSKGSYCPSGATTPTRCPLGKYYAQTRASSEQDCILCPEGSYCSTSGADAVSGKCKQGYWCGKGSSSQTQNQTQAGYYSPQGAIQQLPCLHGTFQATKNQGSCTQCTAGNYCPDTKRKTVIQCPKGQYCPEGSINPKICPVSTFQASVGQTQIASCAKCTQGKYCDGSKLPLQAVNGDCDAGSFCTQGANHRRPIKDSLPKNGICPAGQYCVKGTHNPSDCPSTKFLPSKGAKSSSECLQCLQGYYCATDGLQAPTAKCAAGKKCAAGSSAEVNCSTANHFCPQGSAVELQCPDGQQGKSGFQQCTQCQQGYYCADKNKTTCPAGSYCPAGSKAPTLCQIGKYNDLTGQHLATACKNCPAGKACPHSGIQTPLDCAPGFFCLESNTQVKPIQTEYGNYAKFGHYTTGIEQKRCEGTRVCNRELIVDQNSTDLPTCGRGYQCDFGTRVVLLSHPRQNDQGGRLCPAGSKCDTDAGTASQCPGGQYGPSTGAQSCVECPYGFGCRAGATSPLDECPTGHYCDKGTQYTGATADTIQSTICSAGYQCPKGSFQQIQCPAGFYQPSGGQSSCIQCEAGFFCAPTLGAALAAQKVACPVGHKCPSKGMTHPTPCAPGQYQNQTQKTECKTCPATKYCPESKMSAANKSCPAGRYCPQGSRDLSKVCEKGYYCPANSSTQTPCPSGQYCAQQGLATPSGSCIKGYICIGKATQNNPTDGTTGKICPQGHYCEAGASSQTPCPVNTYMNFQGAGVVGDCIDCKAGEVCKGTGNVQPDNQCPAGKYCLTPGSQLDCPAGYRCPKGTFLPIRCQPGSIQTQVGKDNCVICPAGSYCQYDASVANPYKSGEQLTKQKDCIQGYYCQIGAAISYLKPCPVGTYGASAGLASSSQCTACTEKSYCDRAGLTAVSGICADGYLCPQGSDRAQKTVCPRHNYCKDGIQNACPDGTYTHTTGASVIGQCIKCSPGFFCPTQNTNIQKCPAGSICGEGLSKASEATQCVEGNYCPQGSYVQTKCNIGTFNNLKGQASCTQCPAGKYCKDVGMTTDGLNCPNHFVCILGSQWPQTCPPGTYQSSGTCTSCPKGSHCWPRGQGTNKIDSCDSGFVCQGGAFSPTPYTTQNIQRSSSNFSKYNGYAIKGYFSNSSTSHANEICPIGKFQNSRGAGQCNKCPVGYYCDTQGMTSADLKQCPAGFICDTEDDRSAPPSSQCTGDKYCGLASSIALFCPDGFKVNAANSACDLCPSNNYCFINPDSDSFNQVACITGSVCTLNGLQRQPLCGLGKYLNLNTCVDCPAGKFCRDGQASDNLCISGFSCPPGQQNPDIDGNANCKQGHYCEAGTAPGDQKQCANDTFRATLGGKQQTDCNACTPGYICTSGNINPERCEQGFYCPLYRPGSSVQNIQKIPCPKKTFGATQLLAFKTSCTNCPAGSYCPNTNQTEQTPCPKGKYCEIATQSPYDCFPGTYAGTTRTPSSNQCQVCPIGSFCGAGTIQPTSCTGGNYCPASTQLAKRVCRGGAQCNEETQYLERTCDSNFYCPRGSISQIECPQGYICKRGSEYYQSCGLGKKVIKISDKIYGCVNCPAGEYSDKHKTSECEKCLEGYYCPSGTSKKFPDTICPPGHYCPAGSGSPMKCPKGTYRATNGATSANDCIRCPENAFSQNQGEVKCMGCGPDATSLQGSFTCQCRGKFRAFQPTDSACRCQPGYKSIPVDGAVQDQTSSSSLDCQPIQVSRCQGQNQVRTAKGECKSLNDCKGVCGSKGGTRNRLTGFCQCVGAESLDYYCNASCQSSSVKQKVTADNTISIQGKNTALTSMKQIQFTGSIQCNTQNQNRGCNIKYSIFDSNGLYGSFNPPKILGGRSLLQKQEGDRVLITDTNSTAGNVPNPLICINQGDSMMFQVKSPNIYPVYQKDSLLNTNFSFNYAEFLKLATTLSSRASNPNNLNDDNEFITPVYFGYTFTQPGNYFFTDNNSSAQNSMLITVMSVDQNCPSTAQIQLQTADNLGQFGIEFRGNLIENPDHLQIVIVIFFFVLGIGSIFLAQQLFTKLSWRVSSNSVPYFRQKQAKFNLVSLEITKQFYEQNQPGYARLMQEQRKREREMWNQEFDDMDDINLEIIPEIQEEVAKLMEEFDRKTKVNNKQKKGIQRALDGLESQLYLLKLQNDRQLQEQIMRDKLAGGKLGDIGDLIGQTIEKPELDREEDLQVLKNLKKQQKKKEEDQKKNNEVIKELEKKQKSIFQNIQNNEDLNDREKQRLMLEMEQNQKELASILAVDKDRQDADFRRLLKQRAERKKKKKEETDQLIKKIEAIQQGKGIDSTKPDGGIIPLLQQQKIQEEILQNLDKDIVDKVDQEIETQKLDSLNEIEQQYQEKKRVLELDYDAEKGKKKSKDLVNEMTQKFKRDQEELNQEREKSRLNLMKQLEARRRKKLFNELKQKALDQAEEIDNNQLGQNGNQIGGRGDNQLKNIIHQIGDQNIERQIQRQKQENQKEIDQIQEQNKKEMEQLIQNQQEQLRLANQDLNQSINAAIDKQFIGDQDNQQSKRNTIKLDNLQEQKKRLEMQLEGGEANTQEEADNLLDALRQKQQEMQELMARQRENQLDDMNAKLKRRKQMKREKMQRLLEKQQKEQIELKQKQKKNLKDKKRETNIQQIEILLQQLVKKYQEHNKDGGNDNGMNIQELMKAFEEIMNDKMLQEMADLLSRQITNKEQELTALINLNTNSRLNDLQKQRKYFQQEVEQLKQLDLPQQVFDQKYQALLIKQQNAARENEISNINSFKQKQNNLLKDLQQRHMAQQVELRQKQNKVRMQLFKKYIADHSKDGSKEKLEKQLSEQLEAFKKEKSQEYQKAVGQLDSKKRLMQQELEKEMSQKIEDYEQLLRMQQAEENDMKQKRENIRALIQQRKGDIARRIEQSKLNAQREQRELLDEHQRMMQEVQGALQNERVRQLQLIQENMEKRKRMKEFKKEKKARNVQNFIEMLNRPEVRQRTIVAKYAGQLKDWSNDVHCRRIQKSEIDNLFNYVSKRKQTFADGERNNQMLGRQSLASRQQRSGTITKLGSQFGNVLGSPRLGPGLGGGGGGDMTQQSGSFVDRSQMRELLKRLKYVQEEVSKIASLYGKKMQSWKYGQL